jgi:hypothetical protein
MSILIGIIAGALITINTSVQEYLQLPLITLSADGKCAIVANFKNGEAFTCSDVDVILRKYRTKKN